MSDHDNQPAIECNEFLAERLPDTRTLLTTLLEALPLELWANADTVQLWQVHAHIPTNPSLRLVCLRCRLLDTAGRELEEGESWYLTAYAWDRPFVAARAVHQPQMV